MIAKVKVPIIRNVLVILPESIFKEHVELVRDVEEGDDVCKEGALNEVLEEVIRHSHEVGSHLHLKLSDVLLSHVVDKGRDLAVVGRNGNEDGGNSDYQELFEEVHLVSARLQLVALVVRQHLDDRRDKDVIHQHY